MYIAGRSRTASSPPNTLIDFASYWCPGPLPVTVSFSLSPMELPQFVPCGVRCICGRRIVGPQWTDFERAALPHPTAKLSLLKQGRRACGFNGTSIRAVPVFAGPTPHPLIPSALGSAGTRRIPASSRPAHRDAAKAHSYPGPNSSSPSPVWRNEVRSCLRSLFSLADVSILEVASTANRPQNYTLPGAFSQASRLFITLLFALICAGIDSLEWPTKKALLRAPFTAIPCVLPLRFASA